MSTVIALLSAPSDAWNDARRDELLAALRARWMPDGSPADGVLGLVYSDVVRAFDENSTVRGIVQLWITEATASSPVTVLAPAATFADLSVEQWAVTELNIKQPTEREADTPPASAVKLLGTAFRRPDFTVEGFFDYWLVHHAPISAAVPGVGGYIVSRVATQPSDETMPDAFIEQWFPSEEVFDASEDTPQAAAAWEDVQNYALTTGEFWLTRESILLPPPAAGPGMLERDDA